jgi:hypothetical protein
VLTAAYPDLAVWTWDYPDPAYWYAYHQHAAGEPFTYDDHGAGTDRQYAPDGGQYPMFIVGVDANGKEITERSNAVRPEDAQPPVVLDAPTLVSLGTVAGDTTWRAVAPVAVDDWQFCTTDNVFDPAVKSFDRWVYEADAPDTEFVVINTTTATVTVDFAYCAVRYRVGETWSSWTGVVDATVIAPSAPSLVSLGTVAADTTWRAVAPVAADGWQFCTSDNAFDPQVKTFDRWVYEADAPDTEYVIINLTTATVTVDFGWCAARYRVGTTWSDWTGVVDATVITPPAQLVLSSDGHGHLTWTCNFIVDTAFIIQHSEDGVNWSDYDAQDCDKFYRDSSGQAGYFRIAIGDEDGNAVPPYSNVVHSDGL